MNTAEKLIQMTENEMDIYALKEQLKQRVNGGTVDAKSWYDDFWDDFQDEGKRVNYARGFSGTGFTFSNFYPKYNITAQGSAIQMFYGWSTKSSHVGNLEQRLIDRGVVLDTSEATDMTQAFAYGRMSHLPLISLKKCTATTSTSNAFAYCYQYLKSVKIEVSKDTKFVNMFLSTNGIEHLSVTGVIGQNGFDVHWSTKLSADSLKSIIDALSTTTTGLTITLPTTAQTNYEAVYGTGSWAALTTTKNNWNIDYA